MMDHLRGAGRRPSTRRGMPLISRSSRAGVACCTRMGSRSPRYPKTRVLYSSKVSAISLMLAVSGLDSDVVQSVGKHVRCGAQLFAVKLRAECRAAQGGPKPRQTLEDRGAHEEDATKYGCVSFNCLLGSVGGVRSGRCLKGCSASRNACYPPSPTLTSCSATPAMSSPSRRQIRQSSSTVAPIPS